jgi:hypothetical protein
MHNTLWTTYQKDGSILRVVTQKTTNVLGMLSFLWWQLIPFRAYNKPIYSQGSIIEISKG